MFSSTNWNLKSPTSSSRIVHGALLEFAKVSCNDPGRLREARSPALCGRLPSESVSSIGHEASSKMGTFLTGQKSRRTVKTTTKRTPTPPPDIISLLASWAVMFGFGVLPTAFPYTMLSLCYAFTLDNPDLGQLWPFALRLAPSLYLMFRIYQRGRPDRYMIRIVSSLLLATAGDCLFMNKDETSFLMAMGFYAAMHVCIVSAMEAKKFCASGLGISSCLALSWILLLVPHLSEKFIYLVPPYIFLVCATLWRAWAQPNFEFHGTKICAFIGALFFLVAHLNLSMNAFGVVQPYDYLNVITIVLFSMGQVMMGISTFEEREVFEIHNLRR